MSGIQNSRCYRFHPAFHGCGQNVGGKIVRREMYWYTLLRTLIISEFSIEFKVYTANKLIISKRKYISPQNNTVYVKTDMIQTNPADKVELPKVEKYSGNVYNKKQLEELFQAIKGDPAEFGVVTAAFYGLRRREVVGLKWDAVDFEKKTITIKHTIQQT